MNEARLGPWLRTHREQLGLRQEELAERIGVSQPLVSRWERGLSVPSGKYLDDLANVLDIPRGEALARMGGFATNVETAIVSDTHLDQKSQDILLAAYGVMMGRDSRRMADVLRANWTR